MKCYFYSPLSIINDNFLEVNCSRIQLFEYTQSSQWTEFFEQWEFFTVHQYFIQTFSMYETLSGLGELTHPIMPVSWPWSTGLSYHEPLYMCVCVCVSKHGHVLIVQAYFSAFPVEHMTGQHVFYVCNYWCLLLLTINLPPKISNFSFSTFNQGFHS